MVPQPPKKTLTKRARCFDRVNQWWSTLSRPRRTPLLGPLSPTVLKSPARVAAMAGVSGVGEWTGVGISESQPCVACDGSAGHPGRQRGLDRGGGFDSLSHRFVPLGSATGSFISEWEGEGFRLAQATMPEPSGPCGISPAQQHPRPQLSPSFRRTRAERIGSRITARRAHNASKPSGTQPCANPGSLRTFDTVSSRRSCSK